MKVTVEKPSESEALMTAELDWSELEKASERAYKRLVQKYNIPGFRKGHAPRSVLERMVGKETLYQEGLEALMDEAYREAIKSNELAPLGDPEIDAPTLQMNEPFTFTARIPILAPVHLGDYQSVRVDIPSAEVSEEDIDKVVENLRDEQTTWNEVARPAQVGDRVMADLRLMVGEKRISNLKDNEFELAETREGIFAGMDEHLLGVTAGETKEFTTTIPADYGNAELAGKEAHYTVTIKAVKEREVPAIDDELAKASGDYETLGGLRTAIREELTDRRQSNARREFRDGLLKAIAEQAEVEIHPVLVAGEASDMTDEFKRLLERNGLDFETYLKSVSKTEAEYKQEIEPEARERVKRDLVLDAVADAEGVQINDDDMANWLQFYNVVSGGKPVEMSQLSAGQRAAVATRIRRDKVTEQLVKAAGWVDAPHDHDHEEHEEHEGGDETASVEANAAHAAQVAAALPGDASAETSAEAEPVEAAPESAPTEADASSMPAPPAAEDATAAPEASE